MPPTSVRMKISGMACEACAGHVKKALLDTPGVTSASVDLAAGSAQVQYDPQKTNVKDLENAVEQAGYHGQAE